MSFRSAEGYLSPFFPHPPAERTSLVKFFFAGSQRQGPGRWITMDELARLLSVEYRLLELLVVKLAEGRRALDRVREVELRRSMLVADLARDLDVPEDGLTLSALARDSREPYGIIFADHRSALLELAAEIEDSEAEGYQMPSLSDFLRR